MRAGDVLLAVGLGRMAVESASVRPGPGRVCNLTVEGLPSFAVGACGLLVHNTELSRLADLLKREGTLSAAEQAELDTLKKAALNAPKGPTITTPGKLTPEDLASNLKGITDPTAKRIAISEYMEALKAQRVAAGKTLDYTTGVTKDGGVVFYGPARGVASPVGAGGEINRNVILVTRDGKVYQMTLEGLSYVNPKLKHPIVDADLLKGRAIELPH